MYNLEIKNNNNYISLVNTDRFVITNIDGLSPTQSLINTYSVAGVSGGVYSSSTYGMRQIILTIKIKRTNISSVEENRNFLYSLFPSNKELTLRYSNGIFNSKSNTQLEIKGYVETFECNMFSSSETAIISILCPNPFFTMTKDYELDFTATESSFVFPFYFKNGGITFDSTSTSSDATVNVSDYESLGVVETGCIFTITGNTGKLGMVTIKHTYGDKNTTFSYNGHIARYTDIVNSVSGEKDFYSLNTVGAKITRLGSIYLGTSEWITLKPGVNKINFPYVKDEFEMSLKAKILIAGV